MKHSYSASIFLATLLFSVKPNCVSAQDGVLDPTFGTAGLVTMSNGTFDDGIHDMVIQPDGKIVVAGHSFNTTYDFIIARLNTDGSPDTDFGTNGVVVVAIDPEGQGEINGDRAWGVALAPGGGIVAVGEAHDGSAVSSVAIVSLNSDGSFNTVFDGDGLGLFPVAGTSAFARSCVVDGSSNIYLTGSAYSTGQMDVLLMKVDYLGQLDLSFGPDGTGIVVYPVLPFDNDLGNKILFDNDGKLMVAGTASVAGDENFLVMRFNTDGTLDGTFSSGGQEIIGFFGSFDEQCYAMAIQPDGNILLAGHVDNYFYDAVLTRWLAVGAMGDASFGSGSIVYTDHGTGVDMAQTTDMLLQPDGKIIISGLAILSNRTYYCMTRYTADGELDLSFGTDGFVYTSFTANSNDQATAAALQTDGRILLAGGSYDGQNFISVARYNNPSIAGPIGIGEAENAAFTLYPNPTQGIVRLNDDRIETGDLLTVTDVLGATRMEHRVSTDGALELDLTSLPAGLYCITVTMSGKSAVTQQVAKF